MKFRSAFIATACAALVQILPGVASADTPKRLAAAAETLNSLSKASDSEIPADLLKKASCVVVIPSMKSGALVVGAEYGRGFASCRTEVTTTFASPGAPPPLPRELPAGEATAAV